MPISHSAVPFMLRAGIIDETFSPAPRLNVTDLLINRIPVSNLLGAQNSLRSYEGMPAPNRGATHPWPSDGNLLL
jgi:hypothetical protein